ncbi:tetratricopeptide repeat protein [Devosia sp.]|uniref:tetratricopeptide repeat protein n=1 Tax=Devosia sp. TaxID=1871048 RepID=UPI0026213358|nr:tetratricopeptide repeat protein [Devosia sp.]
MRTVFPLVIAVLLSALGPAPLVFAQSGGFSVTQSSQMDALFARLSAATDEAEARAIADEIWQIWTHPDDTAIAARMQDIIAQSGFAGPASQMPLIDALVADYPDYSEGWNLRATAHFLNGAYEKSLLDIEETLKREPRHFGAMAGRALIYHTQGKSEEAMKAIQEALEIHPFLPERGLFPDLGPPPIRS